MFHSRVSSSQVGGFRRLAAGLLILVLCTTGFITGPGGESGSGGKAGAVQPLSLAYPASDPHNFVYASTDISIDNLDPALAYDTASFEIIQNTYDTLVFYNGADPGTFVPQLADSYNLSGNSLTWTFHIRSGVTFHNGDSLTPADVAYTFQRGLLQGGSNSPQWLLTEPFFGIGIMDISQLIAPDGSLTDNRDALKASNPSTLLAACNQVKAAIVADNAAGTVTMHLSQRWAPFLGTIAQPLGSILDKSWAIDQGTWDGSCSTWQNWYYTDSSNDPLSGLENGTGPFKLDHLTQGVEVLMNRNDAYWRTPSQLAHVTLTKVADEATRLSMLQTGQADQVSLSSPTYIATADGLTGENCVYNATSEAFDCTVVSPTKLLRRYIGQPSISQDEILLNWNISVSGGGNPYIGTGVLDGNGIPVDFFSDEHVRKAFNYAFDWASLNTQMWGGSAIQPTSLLLPGMPGYDLGDPHYTYSLANAATEFHASTLVGTTGGSLWNTGFHLTMLYNAGNNVRQKVAELLAASLLAINPKFVMDVASLPWADYQTAQYNGRLPIWTAGWTEDIHDPHNWYVPFLVNIYAVRSNLPDTLKAEFQTFIEDGVTGTSFAARAATYQILNQDVYDHAPFILLGRAAGHRFITRRAHGVITNPIFAGDYYYPIYKDPPFSTLTPSVPSLKSPKNKALITGTLPVLDWNDSKLSKGVSFGYYQVQVATNTAFTSGIVVDRKPAVSTYTVTGGLSVNTTYYWRVRAFNLWDNPSAWSKPWAFRTSLPAPTGLHWDGSIQNLRPTLYWSMPVGYPGPAPTSYTVQISINTIFSPILMTATAPAASTPNFTLLNDLPVNQDTLWWHVRANGANGPSDWSELSHFGTGNPPSIPRLVSPKNNAVVSVNPPPLDWSDSTAPTGAPAFKYYRLQVDNDADFSSPLINKHARDLTVSNFTPAAALAIKSKFYWRVQACNEVDDCSAWSLVWSFKTK